MATFDLRLLPDAKQWYEKNRHLRLSLCAREPAIRVGDRLEPKHINIDRAEFFVDIDMDRNGDVGFYWVMVH